MSVTVCVRCRYHANTHPGGSAGPRPDTWYYQICRHPDLEHPKGIDPVSGKMVYWAKNDLGMTYPADRHPNCRDINDGHCKYFVGRTG